MEIKMIWLNMITICGVWQPHSDVVKMKTHVWCDWPYMWGVCIGLMFFTYITTVKSMLVEVRCKNERKIQTVSWEPQRTCDIIWLATGYTVKMELHLAKECTLCMIVYQNVLLCNKWLLAAIKQHTIKKKRKQSKERTRPRCSSGLPLKPLLHSQHLLLPLP